MINSIILSYYWFEFGNSITTVITVSYNLINILLDWEAFIYGRRRLEMMTQRMMDDLGIDKLPSDELKPKEVENDGTIEPVKVPDEPLPIKEKL